MTDFDKDLIISLSKLLEQTGLSEIEIENKDVGRIKVAKNLFNSNILPSSQNNTNDNFVSDEETKSEQSESRTKHNKKVAKVNVNNIMHVFRAGIIFKSI